MRPKIFMWSDYGASTQKHWRSPSRRSTRSSIGPKILVVAGGVVAGVIGISGIYPQIIDADWVQSAGTDSPHSKNVAISDATTTRRSGICRRHSVAAASRRHHDRRGCGVGTASRRTYAGVRARARGVGNAHVSCRRRTAAK
jgi:hypothetical protein